MSKVDFEKLYDFVDWSYLDSTIRMIIISKNDEQFLTTSLTKLEDEKKSWLQ